MRPHEKLEVWKEGIKLVKDIYLITEKFPGSKKFGIISQLRRAAVSIPTNIAEGSARNTKKEFIQFLYISSGSISEIETLLIISKELDFIKTEELKTLISKLGRISALLSGLIKKLQRSVQ